jgi:hypothetical protein
MEPNELLYITEHQARFAASGQPDPSGTFEIVCITAGNGNGWEFPPDVLQSSLSLWDGISCFIDHAWLSRSVRDLAGQVVNPVWDQDAQGIHATLKAFGPGGDLLTTLGREVLKSENPPKIGFSADIFFKANGKQVTEITRVVSLDLVYNPARGGAFRKAFNIWNEQPILERKKRKMSDENNNHEQLHINPELQLAREQEAEKVMLKICSNLLETSLAAARLPKPSQDHIRKQFAGKIFVVEALEEAIKDQRELLSQLNASQTVSGPGRINSVYNEADKLQAAVDDLFGIERSEKLQAVSVPPLTGIRELYLMLTGDREMHGGYHPDRVQLATTADFTGLVKNALNKMVASQWELLGRAGYDWWQNISQVEHFTSVNDITGTLIGTVGDLPVVEEGAEYTELLVGDSPETAEFVKYGGYIPLTLELIDRDQTRKLKAYARELGSAGLRKISKLVSEVFTANNGIGPTMADTGALFNATAVTTKGGHANLLTTALAIGAWDTAAAAIYNQPMLIKNAAGVYGTGPKMAINPKFCLVPRALQNTAWQMLKGELVREATYVYDNVLKGSAVPITVPEWTDATDWAAVCDPAVAPAIFVGERFGIMPEIYVAGDELSPAVFMNDEHRLKVRHFLAVWVNDFRPLHKSNVAG